MLRNSLHQRRQQGFTLIELVIVIVIIGILAAIALPKFASLAADARAGAIKGVAGTLASTNAAIYAKVQTLGTANMSNTSLTGCSAAVSTTLGYAANMGDILNCVSLTPSTDFVINGAAGAGTVAHSGATTQSKCYVNYVPPVANTSNLSPIYNIVVTDCS